MELRHLRYFIAVGEEQSVTRAAARLHLSQPALSRQIHDLEEELGAALFHRTPRSVTLTKAGDNFMRHARAVLLRVDEALESVRSEAKILRGTLRVGYSPSLAAEFLPKVLRSFEGKFPDVQLSLHDLSSEECIEKLTTKKIDLALTVSLQPLRQRRGITFEKLTSYAMMCAVAASHPLAHKTVLKLAELKDHDLVIYSQDDFPEYLKGLRALVRPYDIELKIGGEYDGVTSLLTAVEAGRGLAIVSASVRSLTGPGVKLLPLVPKPPPLFVGAAFASAANELVREFVLTTRQALEAPDAR